MKNIKNIALIGFALIALPSLGFGQHFLKNEVNTSVILSGNPNIDFGKLAKLYEEEVEKSQNSVGKSVSESRLEGEKIKNQYRKLGIQLWQRYPQDERRYVWFQNTMQSEGSTAFHYWQDINSGNESYYNRPSVATSYSASINWEELEEWEKLYPQMKREYFEHFGNKSKANIPGREIRFATSELESFLMRSLNVKYRKRDGTKKIDMKQLEALIIQATGVLALPDTTRIGGMTAYMYRGRPLRAMDNDFLARYKAYGISDKELNVLLEKFIRSDNPGLKEWGIQRKALMRLKKEPLQLAGTSIRGKKIDLEKMRGKVVLVDFWATTCSSCIERMPAIKVVYDKYKNQGFEVISVCLNGADEKEFVAKVEQKIGADWQLLLRTTKNKEGFISDKEILDKYGFWGVPQLLLLDKKGKLVMLNDVLRDGDFEPLLKKLLVEKI